jgi:hypothetical protein
MADHYQNDADALGKQDPVERSVFVSNEHAVSVVSMLPGEGRTFAVRLPLTLTEEMPKVYLAVLVGVRLRLPSRSITAYFGFI